MVDFHITGAGTKLPILILKGKQYLEVKYRIVWFREEHPDWSIETDFLKLGPEHAVAKAVIKNSLGVVIATSHKFEDASGFADFIEKAETGSIGRALALIGYGTQFCADEFDEGARIVDSPVAKSASPGSSAARVVSPSVSSADYKCSFGKKYKGLTVKQIVSQDGLPAFQQYLNYFKDDSKKSGKPLSYDVKNFISAGERYLSEVLGEDKDLDLALKSSAIFSDDPWPTSEN